MNYYEHWQGKSEFILKKEGLIYKKTLLDEEQNSTVIKATSVTESPDVDIETVLRNYQEGSATVAEIIAALEKCGIPYEISNNNLVFEYNNKKYMISYVEENNGNNVPEEPINNKPVEDESIKLPENDGNDVPEEPIENSEPVENIPTHENQEQVTEKNLSMLNESSLKVIADDIDFSSIQGYYSSDANKVWDNTKHREEIIKMLEDSLKSQIESQLDLQLKALGLEFKDIENLFDNVFLKTAWDVVASFDNGARIKYNVANLINKFVETLDVNLDNAIIEMNKSNNDLDLMNLDYSYVVDNYDVVSGERNNTKTKNGAIVATNTIAENLYEQLKVKTQQMCKANNIEFDEEIFNVLFNNSKKYAQENCDMDRKDKKFNSQMFVEEFLNNFKNSYTNWVETLLKNNNTQNKTVTELTMDDVAVDTSIIDYSLIQGYYTNKSEKSSDSVKNKEKLVKMLEENLKAQLKKQLEDRLESLGIDFKEIENLFNNVFLQTAWETINSFDKGLRIKYNTSDLINKFLEKFNSNMDNAVAAMNKSDKDFDLIDIDYNSIVDKYDVESGEREKIGAKNAAENQAKTIANELKSQLRSKAEKMCTANGISFSEAAFNTQFNNALAYSLENCEMSSKGKKYNATIFLEVFLNKFKSNYTDWVERQK